MLSLQSVLIDALWIIGLAILLATVSYMSWYKSVNGWGWRYALNLPHMLLPLCVGLAIFCVGMALNGRTAFEPAPWWETVVWSILAALFCVQSVLYARAGMRHGWDTPVEGRRNDRA